MNDNCKPNRRSGLLSPINLACCRWAPIEIASIDSGKAATSPDPGQGRETPSDQEPAGSEPSLEP